MTKDRNAAENKNARLAKRALLLLLVAVFLYSAFQLVSSLLEYNENQRAFEDVREEFVQVEIPEPPDAGIPHAVVKFPTNLYRTYVGHGCEIDLRAQSYQPSGHRFGIMVPALDKLSHHEGG